MANYYSIFVPDSTVNKRDVAGPRDSVEVLTRRNSVPVTTSKSTELSLLHPTRETFHFNVASAEMMTKSPISKAKITLVNGLNVSLDIAVVNSGHQRILVKLHRERVIIIDGVQYLPMP